MMASRQRLPVFGYFTRKMCRSPLKLSKVIYRRRGSIKRPASHYYFTWALFDLVLLVLPKNLVSKYTRCRVVPHVDADHVSSKPFMSVELFQFEVQAPLLNVQVTGDGGS
jgi:hypothetical protein